MVAVLALLGVPVAGASAAVAARLGMTRLMLCACATAILAGALSLAVT